MKTPKQLAKATRENSNEARNEQSGTQVVFNFEGRPQNYTMGTFHIGFRTVLNTTGN